MRWYEHVIRRYDSEAVRIVVMNIEEKKVRLENIWTDEIVSYIRIAGVSKWEIENPAYGNIKQGWQL